MVHYLAAKIGINEAARPDPVGVRVRSPSQKTPQNNSRSPQRSVNQRRQLPRTVGFGIPKLPNVLLAHEIEDVLWILFNLAKARCRTTFWWFIRPDRWCNMVNSTIWAYGSAGLVCPEKSGQDRPMNDNGVRSSYHSAVSPAVILGDFTLMQRHAMQSQGSPQEQRSS